MNNVLKLGTDLYVNGDNFVVLSMNPWTWNRGESDAEYRVDIEFANALYDAEYSSHSFKYSTEEERDAMVETLKQYL